MKKNVFYTLIILFFVINLYNLGHAFDLDETVDDDIRKNYNPTKISDDMGLKVIKSGRIKDDGADEDLPALPNIGRNKSANKSEATTKSAPPKLPVYRGGNTKVHKGTVFPVVSSGSISDWQGKGTKVKFTSTKQVSGRGYTIPAHTTFYGEIIESHQPQVSCNGGLVVIRINSMIYKGQTVPLKGYVIQANGKKIFLNNIKGKRTYLKTMYKKGNWGRSLFGRMLSLTINLGGSGSTILLSPFPLAYGTICLGANTLISPITAFFSKGGHVSIPAGSNFKIRLLENLFI